MTLGSTVDERAALALGSIAALVARPAEEPGDQVLSLLVAAVALVPNTESATLVDHHPTRAPRTFEAIDERGRAADALQFSRTRGPVLDAVTAAGAVVTADLTGDGRWPELHHAADGRPRARSAVCIGLRRDGISAVLAFYSAGPDRFDPHAVVRAQTVTGVVETALAGLAQRKRAQNLHRALLSNRQIGVAVGVLMVRHRWTEQNAFAELSTASQSLNRRLADIAEEVCLTGILPAEHSRD